MLGLLFLVSICVFNFTVYVPLVVRTVLHLGAEGFGLLMACLGVGAVTGALTVGVLGARQPPTAMLFSTAALACGGLLALSTARVFWFAAVAVFLTGLFGVVLVASCNTAMQLAADDMAYLAPLLARQRGVQPAQFVHRGQHLRALGRGPRPARERDSRADRSGAPARLVDLPRGGRTRARGLSQCVPHRNLPLTLPSPPAGARDHNKSLSLSEGEGWVRVALSRE